MVTKRSHWTPRLEVKAACNALAQVKMERTVVIEDAGAGQCRYRITGSVKVKMFGIGHLVEKQVMSNSVDSLGLLAQVVDRCAAKPYTFKPYMAWYWCAVSSWAALTAWACTRRWWTSARLRWKIKSLLEFFDDERCQLMGSKRCLSGTCCVSAWQVRARMS